MAEEFRLLPFGQRRSAKRSGTSRHFHSAFPCPSRYRAMGVSALRCKFLPKLHSSQENLIRRRAALCRFTQETSTNRCACGQAFCKKKDGKFPNPRAKPTT